MNDRGYLLDASALLALFYGEPGSARVGQILDGAAISAVNLSEVIAKLYDRELSSEAIALNLSDANLKVLPFEEAAALKAGELREKTRSLGISLADRSCLATALVTGRTAVTADRTWTAFADLIDIEMIR